MNSTAWLRRWFAPLCAIALLSSICAVLARESTAAEWAEMRSAANSITKEEVKTFVDVLADDTFEGREAGSRGGRAAGNYLMKEFERHGLIPAGDSKGYFQSFNGSARNILGLVEGNDEQLKQQVIVVGAHYDHVGYGRATNSFGPFGYVHNGADDNASGVSGLLEVMAAVKQLPQPPKRSILFALWDAEEQGLLGSQHWLANPTIPTSRIVLVINLDMIGRLRNSKLEVMGSRSSANLRRTVSLANRDQALEVDFTYKMKADSDHWPFYSRSIPILMFHTGLHGEYHRPSDDAHLINSDGIASVAKVVLLSAVQLADTPLPIKFRPTARNEHAGSGAALEQPITPQPARYGMPFQVEPGDPPRFVLSGVTPGSAAEKAGLKAGDRLVAFQGEPIADERKLRLELLAARGEVTLQVERAGSEVPIEIKVTPAGQPVRIGFTWRVDEAEPQAVILTQVIYGSAAHVAGLRLRDRIYEVNGQSFTGSDDFMKALLAQVGPIDLLVERSGKVQTIRLEPLPAM
jgi:hypothetical protein